MSSAAIRTFHRSDREQLAELVNAHVAAVIPGVSVSVSTVMSQLEREPHEPVVDPWVVERRTLVAVERAAVVGAALLLRYAAGEEVGPAYRASGEIRWLVCLPDHPAAGDRLAEGCVRVLEEWRVERQLADGGLPSLACTGVPACWPHVRAIYERAGFEHRGDVEAIFVAAVSELPTAGPAPLAGLLARREVGVCGTRFTAVLDGCEIGLIEVATDLTSGGVRSRYAGWADIGNLHVSEHHRRLGVGTWLVAGAAAWLRLGRVERVVDYADPDRADLAGFLARIGFHELTRNARRWERPAR